MSRRETVGRVMARRQSSNDPPAQEWVSVAVLPPRLDSGMAPSAIGPSECFGWDEQLNWQHNDPIVEEDPNKKKSFRKRIGLTTERQRANPEFPPFMLRQVPYDTWRKHYAKDKDGNYHGTHAPAMDCLLKPDDVAKWRLEPMKVKGDKWTRGAEVLPVYQEVQEEEASAPVPSYEPDYAAPPSEKPRPSNAENNLAPTVSAARSVSTSKSSGKPIADGKTAEEIIQAAMEKKRQETSKQNWKNSLKLGFQRGLMS